MKKIAIALSKPFLAVFAVTVFLIMVMIAGDEHSFNNGMDA